MNIHNNSQSIEIRVDRRTELLGIIQIISNYRKKFPHLLEKHGNKNYVEEIENQFYKYKDHNCIKLFNEIVENNNFSYDAPISLFLQLNNDFSFTKLDTYPFIERLNSDPKVIEFLKTLPGFANDINFDLFYNKNKQRYFKFVNNVKKQLDLMNPVDFMLNYYGLEKQVNFVVNLIPFQTWGNYGTKNENYIYANICSLSNTTLEDEIYPSDIKTINGTYLLYHEFNHSFINPLTEKYHIISNDNPIFQEIMEPMKKQAYGCNDLIINEHIIRALTLRYQFYSGDIDGYNFERNREKQHGFIFIDNIIDSLCYYEKNRNIYPNIDKYYPVIIQNMIMYQKHSLKSSNKKHIKQ